MPYQTRLQGDAKGLHINCYTDPFRITKHTKIQMKKNESNLNVWKLSYLKAGQCHQRIVPLSEQAIVSVFGASIAHMYINSTGPPHKLLQNTLLQWASVIKHSLHIHFESYVNILNIPPQGTFSSLFFYTLTHC